MAAGCTYFLAKPFDVKRLRDVLEDICDAKKEKETSPKQAGLN
jgi:DNA-binding NtrC family response regulator